MILFFRVVLVLLKSLLRRRMDIAGESVIRTRVWPTDMDLNFHLNDGRYVSLTGLGRIDLMLRTGLLRKAMKRGWYPVAAAILIRYRREIRAMEKFALRSRVAGWDEKWVYFEHRFEKNGDLAALAYARGAMRAPGGAVPIGDVLALIDRREAISPPLPEAVVRWREANIP